MWTIKGYFETIDGPLEEAAVPDGATSWQAFRPVLLPLSVADSGGSVYPVVYRCDHRSTGLPQSLPRDVNSHNSCPQDGVNGPNPQNHLGRCCSILSQLSLTPVNTTEPKYKEPAMPFAHCSSAS